MTSGWISARELSALAGISDRKARQALARRTWRGCQLDVRDATGRGGNAGRSHLVAVSSLPQDLQTAHHASGRPQQLALPLVNTDDRQLAWMLDRVLPIAGLQSGPKRKAAIEDLHGQTIDDWLGRKYRLNRTSLYKWVAAYEAEGVAGLMRKKRSDAGKAKVFVSRLWDAAVPFNDELKAIIANALLLRIRGIWAEGHQISKVKVFSEDYLRQVSGENGFRATDPSVFELSRTRINKERHYSKVACHKQDRKASEDARFRIQRSYAQLKPMHVVVGDVHDLNGPLLSPTGKVVWPSIISFVDVATQRMRSVVIVCEKAGAVRVVDMIEAYLAMVSDPRWGIPRTLYLDNGKENVFAPFLKDAAKLAWQDESGEEQRTLIRATAHNPQAKAHIEARFSLFENHYLKFQQGWSGDNRHDPKVPQLGKRHAPHSAGVDAYFKDFYAFENADNNFERSSGELAGQSPEERFQEFVARGWAAVVVDEQGFNTCFSERKRVQVRRNQIRHDNRFWSCDGLKRYHRDAAFAYIPKYHKFNALVLEDLDGNYIGMAEPNEVLDYLDPRGAINSIKSRQLYYAGLADLRATAEKVDGKQLLIDYAAKRPLGAANPPRGRVAVATGAEPALAITPRRQTLADQRAAKEAERMEILAFRERHSGRRKAS